MAYKNVKEKIFLYGNSKQQAVCPGPSHRQQKFFCVVCARPRGLLNTHINTPKVHISGLLFMCVCGVCPRTISNAVASNCSKSTLCLFVFSLYTRERVCMVCTHVGDGTHGMGNLVRGTTRYITCTSGEVHWVGNCAYLGRGMHMVI